LINNAIKYGKQETPVTVRLTEDEKSYIVSISNEGVGISKEDIEERLFRKFSRLKQKGTEGVKGSGLGLYICKKIVEKHKGKIWAESEVGKYVTFSFSLPK
ncbi:MAG TPA: ATP-binding protein, partial [Spirochaetota bacterium]|nr:ATP-binding protein [Spirochaetota bacterium]